MTPMTSSTLSVLLEPGAANLSAAASTASDAPWEPAGRPAAALLLCCGVLVLSPVILCGNALLLHALYRFKRLRTPSNYLLASLASSDLGVGVVLPLCAYLEVSARSAAGPALLCALPHCLLAALCCASLLVMAAIAVDRFTSLAQPLRYNNLITHRSVERYIAGLWLYAGLAASAPLAARLWGPVEAAPSCSGLALLRPPGVAALLVCAVYAPCALLVVGCYSYVYLVARTHHRAIYSVEISLRHAHDAPYASRYTSTLAITVGLFVGLWMPFQVTMLVDLMCGSPLTASSRTLSLSLPMFASSALNPWVYGYRNGEVRAAVQRVLDEVLAKLGLSSPHLGCPHLMTTGVDAELNSFASNVRLCTASAHSGNGNHTHHTLVGTASSASPPHPDGPVSPATPEARTASASPSPSTPTPTPPAAPAPAAPAGRPAKATARPARASSATATTTSLLVPGGPGAGRAAAAPATVITLAQTVIELRVPVPDRHRPPSLRNVHHV